MCPSLVEIRSVTLESWRRKKEGRKWGRERRRGRESERERGRDGSWFIHRFR